MLSWITVLDKIANKFDKDTAYIFGHSGTGYEVTGKKGDVLAFKEYIQKVLDFTQSQIKAGVSKEDFIKNTEVPGVTEWKGDGLQRPLTAAYEELTSK